ncbi:MAG TPA: hypothetical protein DEB39_07360 [Planctomycetaceae bacterium]|nr:hypothetical protein [Planctomycetaceae bacterium]
MNEGSDQNRNPREPEESSIHSGNIGSGYAYRVPLEERKTPPKPATASKDRDNPFSLSSQSGQAIIALLALMFIVLLVVFCAKPKEKPDPDSMFAATPAVVKYNNVTIEGKRFLGIEATRKSRHAALIGEVSRVLQENATPADLFLEIPRPETSASKRDDATDSDTREGASGSADQDTVDPDDRNIAVQLRKHFAAFEKNRQDFDQLEGARPLGAWRIMPATLKQVAPVLERLRPQRELIRQVLNDDKAFFGLDFVNVKRSPTPDPRTPDMFRDYVLLEEFAVARALENKDMREATESLRHIFRIARLASFAKNMPVRFAAIEARLKGLNILQTLVGEPSFDAENRGLLRESFHRTLANWPSDSLAWVGERAHGMQVFDAIRVDGILPEPPLTGDALKDRKKWRGRNKAPMLVSQEEILQRMELSVFSPRDLDVLNSRGIILEVNDNLYRTIDPDEVFFLKWMRLIIGESEKPYYKQRETLELLVGELNAKQDREDEPYISDLLLRSAPGVARQLAADRAQFEAFFIALAIAESSEKGENEAANRFNPLTGGTYTVNRTARNVIVKFHNDLEPFIVPLPAAQ